MSVLKTYGADTESFKPSLTYQMKNGRIQGTIDGLEAAAQAVDLILSTERYKYAVCSTDYGVELEGLVGARKALIRGDIRRRIEEALRQDDRLVRIREFNIAFDREVAKVDIVVQTIFGDVERSLRIG